jgi:asparagine synthase (glutamine-hydrolysing)
MCGIFGFVSDKVCSQEELFSKVNKGLKSIAHRGPDGEGIWGDPTGHVGLGHVRLAIIGIEDGAQPMKTANQRYSIVFNGEIYNYKELREELGCENFRTNSDTEVLLKGYERWGEKILDKLRGMFAFAIWDNHNRELFLARDHFGIKPLYWTIEDGCLYFASEQKAILPFLNQKKICQSGLSDYFTFQYTIGTKTLFDSIQQLAPAHYIKFKSGVQPIIQKYWEVHYDIDYSHTEDWFVQRLRELLDDSVKYHLRSDVEVGSYASGGVDSSLLAILASKKSNSSLKAFNGRFDGYAYDESHHAASITHDNNIDLSILDITENDFVDNIKDVIWHLDQPTAGPGSFAQYMVSKRVSQDVKVVLGGQGGDEIFGGYARYLVAYFEQCIKGAMDGTLNNGNYLVTYESIIPNLRTLEGYKPMLKEFWADGLFAPRDERYWRLVNRSNKFGGMIDEDVLNNSATRKEFSDIYWGKNVGKESYFDSMTHFDFKTLLPALLSVEDRMSMAHGLEARVPLLDRPLVEFAATIPADVKFKDGELKRLMKGAFRNELPSTIVNRKDKMGFPVPLNDWIRKGGKARDFVGDILGSSKAVNRDYLAPGMTIDRVLDGQSSYGRNLWALLSLELWQLQCIDN